MKMLFRGYDLASYNDEIVTIYKPHMDVIHGVVYVADADIEIEEEKFDRIVTVVFEDDNVSKVIGKPVRFETRSKDYVRSMLHRCSKIINSS